MSNWGELLLAIDPYTTWRIAHPNAVELPSGKRGGRARLETWSNDCLADRAQLAEWNHAAAGRTGFRVKSAVASINVSIRADMSNDSIGVDIQA